MVFTGDARKLLETFTLRIRARLLQEQLEADREEER